jgi:hypothetical protein
MGFGPAFNRILKHERHEKPKGTKEKSRAPPEWGFRGFRPFRAFRVSTLIEASCGSFVTLQRSQRQSKKPDPEQGYVGFKRGHAQNTQHDAGHGHPQGDGFQNQFNERL